MSYFGGPFRAFEAIKAVAEVAYDSEVPLNLRDRVLVPFVSFANYLIHESDPEKFIASALTVFGLFLFTFEFLGCFKGRERSPCRMVLFVVAVSCNMIAWYVNENLAPVAVLQDLDAYGVQPLANEPALPKLEGKLICDGEFFRDESGRVALLRGVNLGGDSKIPANPNMPTFDKDGFFETEDVSFVGRPFPLEEADEHLSRLRSWGFTFVRFLVTWEAIEHAGPGKYDHEYLEYVRAVIRKCAEHGISVFIDPHQDVWSRWTGGDGAPAWTLTKVGFDLENLHESGAAFSHQMHGDPLPRMVWPTNYNRLATATMFTLFFAGDTFAPKTMIDGVSAQEYLQSHYVNAIKQVATYLKDEPNVLGYDTLNEPSTGYVGLQDLNNALFPAPMGWFISGFQGMTLGAGETLAAPFFSAPLAFSRKTKLNPSGVSAWRSPDLDVWRREGVWGPDPKTGKPKLLRPNHFAVKADGTPAKFMDDFMVPFFTRFTREIRSVAPDTVIFAEPFIDPNKPVHDPAPASFTEPQVAWAPHYYDALALIYKRSRPWIALDIQKEFPAFGSSAASKAIEANLHHVKETGETLGANGAPVLVGEIGTPFDMDKDERGRPYAFSTGDFTSQIQTLDRSIKGLEANFLSYTLWNYAAKNSNRRGDLWNDEDLSLFSRDQQHTEAEINIHSGGRALQAAVRPYPMRTHGTPKELSFDPLPKSRPFTYTFTTKAAEYVGDAPTLIFVPHFQYPHGPEIKVSDGTFEFDAANQLLTYFHDAAKSEHTVSITHAAADAGPVA